MSKPSTNMAKAPKDGPILLMIEGSWVQGYWHTHPEHNPTGRWTRDSFSSEGCGCCGGPDPEPTAWARLPK